MEPEVAFSMTNIDWAAKVKEALDRTDIMALSTIGPDGAGPVQFNTATAKSLTSISSY